MPVCVYDNPATMRRECWQDGREILSYASGLFFLKPEYGGFRRKGERVGLVIDWRANIGEWSTGQLVGDRAALTAFVRK